MTDLQRVAVVYNVVHQKAVPAGEVLSEASVKSMAEEVFHTVKNLGYSVSMFPVDSNFRSFINKLNTLKPDVVINLCEGFEGRAQFEANVAAAMELLKISFTGNCSRALAICQDKYRTKALLLAHTFPTAEAQLVYSPEEEVNIKLPVVVKPNFEDASLGIYADSVCRDETSLRCQIAKALERYRQPVLVEPFIDGREFNVSVIESGRVEALPVSEIDYSGLPEDMPRICTYEAKWFEDHPYCIKTPPVCPAKIDDETREKLQFLAVGAFKILGCRDYARIDFRMNQEGQVFILEVNPNPDVSLDAGYVRALKAAGMEYSAFWEKMIQNAKNRKKANDSADAS